MFVLVWVLWLFLGGGVCFVLLIVSPFLWLCFFSFVWWVWVVFGFVFVVAGCL